MWTLFEIGINLFQAWLLISFMKNRLHLKAKHKIQEIVCIAGIAIWLSVDYFTETSMPDIVVFLFPLFFAFIAAEDSWYINVFWSSVLSVLFLTIVSLIFNVLSTFTDISYEMLLEETNYRIVALLVSNGFLALVIWLTGFLRKDYSKSYWPALAAFLGTIVSFLITEETVYSLQISTEDRGINCSSFIWIYSGILLGVVLTVVLFHLMSRSTENENRYRMEIENIEKTKKYTKELEMMYTKLTEIKHDIKHHYETVENMVLQGQYEDAKMYTKDIQMKLEQTQYRWTGSLAIDALILAKSMSMQKKKIDFHFDPYPLIQLPISESDFCTVLGNILDNAIEGILRIEVDINERSIQLSISRSKDMLYLYCTNPCSPEYTVKTQDGWISSKRDIRKSECGVGIRSIQRIVENAEGRMELYVSNAIFTIKVVLPYNNEETNND